jgi:alanine racemase
MVPVVKYAVEKLGVTEFGCATVGEAKALRSALPKHKFDIYVFSDVQIELKRSSELYLNQRILPVLSSVEDLEFLLGQHDFRHFPICLKFNTGMNRLGIELEQLDEVVTLLQQAGRREIYHLFSHFATASLSIQNKRPQMQYENFRQLKQDLKAGGIEIRYSSMANSGAIEQQFALEETHIRPGLMLYGPSAVVGESGWSGELIGSLKTYVIHTFKVKKGTPVGYGGVLAQDDGVVALLALGYGDGIPTYFQGAYLQYGEFRGRVLGRVNMDMFQLFFSKKEECPIKAGDSFTMWGHDSHYFASLCQQLNVIPYELLCQLTTRIPRYYKS